MSSSFLANTYGDTLIVRPPPPITLNKGGANYKSEVSHEVYNPRQAFREWRQICEGIVSFGGDALFSWEDEDSPFLGHEELLVNASGTILTTSGTTLGNVEDINTGRVFTANGPWVKHTKETLVAVFPHMLSHRTKENTYFTNLLSALATELGIQTEYHQNPHKWEGMADVCIVNDTAILTHTLPGRYDEGIETKSMRSTLEGLTFAAKALGLPSSRMRFYELVYPHFHGDTVHFCLRLPNGEQNLVHFSGGLYGKGSENLTSFLGHENTLLLSEADAVEKYAGNCRQVGHGVLTPRGVSADCLQSFRQLGVEPLEIPLFELFGKAGGGPACATLYLPKTIALAANNSLRYSQQMESIGEREGLYPERLVVSPQYFSGKKRG